MSLNHPTRGCKSSRVDLCALPQPVLELILVSGTETKDKKAFRQTCKHFQRTLDDCLVSTRLLVWSENTVPCLEKFLKRVQHSRAFKKVFLSSGLIISELITNLPFQLTTMTLDGAPGIPLDLQGLTVLRCLTALEIPYYTRVTGLEHVSGLTRLHAHSAVGSVAHLAPTLKHLGIHSYEDVRDLQKLTNLEVLIEHCSTGMPAEFFVTHKQLPLKHLCVTGRVDVDIFDVGKIPNLREQAKAWVSAPSTLTSLTIFGVCDEFPQHLPESITHLQLLDLIEFKDTEDLAAAVPGLKSLDLLFCHCQHDDLHKRVDFSQLSQLTNLNTLSVCFLCGNTVDSQVLLSPLGVDLATVVQLGVKLHVVTDPHELLHVVNGPFISKSVWTTHAWS